jgi:hypothetical protein
MICIDQQYVIHIYDYGDQTHKLVVVCCLATGSGRKHSHSLTNSDKLERRQRHGDLRTMCRLNYLSQYPGIWIQYLGSKVLDLRHRTNPPIWQNSNDNQRDDMWINPTVWPWNTVIRVVCADVKLCIFLRVALFSCLRLNDSIRVCTDAKVPVQQKTPYRPTGPLIR